MQPAQAPRPGQNADGQRKKPQPMQSNMAQPQAAGPSPFPKTMGAGFPDEVQSFPTDMGTLQQMMMAGFAPGANDAQHADAQNAYAMARSQEQMNSQIAQQQMDDEQDMQMLGPLLRKVMERRGQAGAPQGAPAPQPGY
jgi:hypothetical protein